MKPLTAIYTHFIDKGLPIPAEVLKRAMKAGINVTQFTMTGNKKSG
ncbi:hypothetical protein [Microbulbifer epialgicus]|uniref:Uncharacterized protein n=1 Tax=Microbulbifer epialgicus TaxID=393907 RepID=A0ABV4P1R6_9GAMM